MYAYFALAALQAVGGFQQADIIRQNGDLQSSVNNMNARFADLDAFNAKSAGYSNAARYDSVIDSTVGAGRAAYASENVAVGYGTAGDVEKDNKIAGLVNTLQLKRGAENAAAGYQTQAINIRLGGQMTQLQSGLNASAAQTQGIMSAIGTGVTGYQMSNLTGRGRDKDSGTNDKAWQSKTTTINSNSRGDGVVAPDGYSSNLSWHRDPSTPIDSGQPGFFGHSSGPQWQNVGNGNYSFTGETGG